MYMKKCPECGDKSYSSRKKGGSGFVRTAIRISVMKK